jgi:hypothetical protein
MESSVLFCLVSVLNFVHSFPSVFALSRSIPLVFLLLYIREYPYLNKSDILALLPEALTADVEAVFPDDTGLVGADATIYRENRS